VSVSIDESCSRCPQFTSSTRSGSTPTKEHVLAFLTDARKAQVEKLTEKRSVVKKKEEPKTEVKPTP